MKFKKLSTPIGVPGLVFKRVTLAIVDHKPAVFSNYAGNFCWWYELRGIFCMIRDSIRWEKEGLV